MRSLAISAGVAVLALPLAIASADAQQTRPKSRPAPVELGSQYDPFWGRQGDYICRRWCLSDRTPCDPVYFKTADNRCGGEALSSVGVLNCRIEHETRPECPTSRGGR